MNDRSSRTDLPAGIVASLAVVATPAYAAILEVYDSDLYYLSVQEDEYLEWGTFWCFLIAAGLCAACALGQRRPIYKHYWFLLGLGVFCLLVAMEEISWGQRIFGYRPPSYFLEHNFQQELNVHNVFPTTWRKLVLKAVIAGYGVALPLLALVPAVERQLARAAVVVPPPAMIPAFAATFALYEWYPWEYSGEWVELMLGLSLMFVVIHEARFLKWPPHVVLVAVSWSLAVGLGVATAALARGQRDARPETVETARIELEALRRDFLAGRLRTKCGLHKRLYTYMEKYGEDHLLEGEFSRLRAQGLPEARARFFLDPWNSPYWVHDLCSEDRRQRRVFVYSLGPNRLLDSTSSQMRGDDVGALIRRRGT